MFLLIMLDGVYGLCRFGFIVEPVSTCNFFSRKEINKGERTINGWDQMFRHKDRRFETKAGFKLYGSHPHSSTFPHYVKSCYEPNTKIA